MNPLSRPIETLIDEAAAGTQIAHADVVVVGSGYGGSLAALRLAGPGRRVILLERGREYGLGDFPTDLGEVPRHVRFQRGASAAIGYPDALFDFRMGEGMDVLVGSGVGGTSLINANVAATPGGEILEDSAWPRDIRSGALAPHFAAVEKLLGVNPSASDMPKHGALQKLSRSLGGRCAPAPITVTQGAGGLNAVGIVQAPCTRCGNCVTGCNVGAKNTLAMNVLPLAVARGAEIYTGASVRTVVSHAGGWRVSLRRTLGEKTPLDEEGFHIQARIVILAAGTLGSTEILLRSRAAHALDFSPTLGRRFSGNGDALAFGYAQDERVEAIGKADPFVRSDVGPTITGMAQVEHTDEKLGRMRFTLEDGAAPHALSRFFQEVVTTGALVHRLADTKLPAWHERNEDADPIAVTAAAGEHSQVLLLMGDDGAKGRLELEGSQPGSDTGHVVPKWEAEVPNAALLVAGRMLATQDRKDGFDGGQYVPNPLWQVLPEAAAGVLSGAVPGGRAITVHPLGGCCMGEDFASGVVDHRGRVFRAGTQVHDGLLVLDGSVVPRALGINPFLTIAAISHRAAEMLAAENGWPESDIRRVDAPPSNTIAPPHVPSPAPKPVTLVLRERLVGKLHHDVPWLKDLHPRIDRWWGDKGLIIDVEMNIGDVDSWLATGHSLPATARLYRNMLEPEVTARSQMYHTPSQHVTAENLVAQGTGTVCLMRPDKGNALVRGWRALEALDAFWHRRKPAMRMAREALAGKLMGAKSSVGLGDIMEVALFHATYRELEYTFDFPKAGLRLEGKKVLAWNTSTPRVWDSLFKLPFKLSRGSWRSVKGDVEVDGHYLGTEGVPQVKDAPHLPASVAALSGIGTFFARSIFQTHFWDFGAPDYPAKPYPRPTQPARLRIGSNQFIDPEVVDFHVPVSHGAAETIRLRLSRYAQRVARGTAKPVLLVHGLAQGSLIYTEDMQDQNMAAYLHGKGFDVWTLDYRLSNALPEPMHIGNWTMDELGEFDLPEAIRRVHRATGQKVLLFAHCVGATATQMAILKGRVGSKELAAVAFNAIHPWIEPSAVNDFRGLLGKFFRDILAQEPLDPIPSPNPTATEVIFDRLAFSFSRYGEQEGDGHALGPDQQFDEAVCDRMSLLYGRMWRHSNLHPKTMRAFPRIVGKSPGPVYRHMYYLTTRDRVVTSEGLNTYLTDSNIEQNWNVPTFFLHGEDSMVFNPQSATRSARRLEALLKGQPDAPPIAVKRFPGYGHMDVVFGKDAPQTSFKALGDFFAKPGGVGSLDDPRSKWDDPHMIRMLHLSTGPILRAAWIENGAVRIRMWGEMTEHATTTVPGLMFNGTNAQNLGPSWRIPGCEERYQLLDIQLGVQGEVRFDLVPEGFGTLLGVRGDGELEGRPRHFPFSYDDASAPWLARLRQAVGQDTEAADMRFLVGSCRYPGTPFERDLSDAIFERMRAHVSPADGRPGAHMQFFIGDQIYADATANILDTSAWRERFSERYREAFGTTRLKDQLWRLPTHFAIDDHEISDDWSGGKPGPTPYLDRALQAAHSFQATGRGQQPVGSSSGAPLWYSLDPMAERCCPTFVMDTRSERARRSAGTRPPMIGTAQAGALKAWLSSAQATHPEAPKFIVCGSGFGPIPRALARHPQTWRTHDGWLGYPATAEDVLAFIADHQVRNVVFVSGDLHLSALSRMRVARNGRSIDCWNLVASGLFAPLPFANSQPRDFDWNVPVAYALPGVDLTVESGLLCSGESHFLRVDVEGSTAGWQVDMTVHGVKGAVGPAGEPPPGARDAPGDAWAIDFSGTESRPEGERGHDLRTVGAK